MKKLSFTLTLGSRKLVIQRRPGYNIIKNKRPRVDKGKQISGSASIVLEERPEESKPKRQKIEEKYVPQKKEYSPTQSPLHIGDKQLTKDKMEQLGSQGRVFIAISKLEVGYPQEPPMPSLELTVADYKGRELDPMVEQASHEFLSDDSFVKSRFFYQFAWTTNVEWFKERCNKRKEEKLEMEEAALQDQIKDEMMQEFKSLTPEKGRK